MQPGRGHKDKEPYTIRLSCPTQLEDGCERRSYLSIDRADTCACLSSVFWCVLPQPQTFVQHRLEIDPAELGGFISDSRAFCTSDVP